jgi:hypothetical protein
VDFSDDRGWPKASDGDGYSLEIIDPLGDPDDPANWKASANINGSPDQTNSTALSPTVLINEILAKSDNQADWIELFNSEPLNLDLAGWSLAEAGNANRFVFPSSASLAPGSYLIVYCDRQTNSTGYHAPFALSSEGETIILRNPAGEFIHRFTYGPQAPNFSCGYVEGAKVLCVPTAGQGNEPAQLGRGDQLLINEWLTDALPGEADWIELYNPAAEPVSLHNFSIQVGNQIFEITTPAFISPQGYLRLFADPNPGVNHLDFKLPAAGSSITLHSDSGQTLDSISYSLQAENVSQGRFPDGSANIVAFPLSASPGAKNTFNFPIRHSIGTDGFRIIWDAQSGARYRVEFSSDLAVWSSLAEVTATGAQADAKDSTSNLRRYYRVVALP